MHPSPASYFSGYNSMQQAFNREQCNRSIPYIRKIPHTIPGGEDIIDSYNTNQSIKSDYKLVKMHDTGNTSNKEIIFLLLSLLPLGPQANLNIKLTSTSASLYKCFLSFSESKNFLSTSREVDSTSQNYDDPNDSPSNF